MIKAIAIVMAHTYQPVSPTVPGVDIPELLLGHFRNTYMHHTIYSPKIDRARATNFLNYRSLVNNILVTCAFKIMTCTFVLAKFRLWLFWFRLPCGRLACHIVTTKRIANYLETDLARSILISLLPLSNGKKRQSYSS